MKYLTILSALFAFLAAPALAQMAPPMPMSPVEFAHAVTGQSVEIVVRVVACQRTALSAELLIRESDAIYKSAGKSVALYFPQDTPIVMGSSADIKPGAILFVYGVATTPEHADVKKVIVLTAYLKIK